MSRHLSSEEIVKWISGEHDPQVAQHTSSCPACQAELNSFGTAIAVFGRSAREWADQQCRCEAQPLRRVRGTLCRLIIGAVSCTAVATTFCILVNPFAHPRRRVEAIPGTADTDATLLQKVDAEVSQTVPSSMEPLTRLLSWSPVGAAIRPHIRERHARTAKRKSAA